MWRVYQARGGHVVGFRNSYENAVAWARRLALDTKQTHCVRRT